MTRLLARWRAWRAWRRRYTAAYASGYRFSPETERWLRRELREEIRRLKAGGTP